MHWIQALSQLIETHASAWWVLPVVTALAAGDGFFPPLPSESLVVTLAVYGVSGHGPTPWALALAAMLGAVVGDNLGYLVGHHSGLAKLRHSRHDKLRRTFEWAERELDRRGGMLVFVARYIPIGRLAVNLVAGASHFRWRRFVLFDTLACMSWAIYSVAIGRVVGRPLRDHPLVGSVIGIAVAVALGLVIDHAIRRWFGGPASKGTAEEAEASESE